MSGLMNIPGQLCSLRRWERIDDTSQERDIFTRIGRFLPAENLHNLVQSWMERSGMVSSKFFTISATALLSLISRECLGEPFGGSVTGILVREILVRRTNIFAIILVRPDPNFRKYWSASEKLVRVRLRLLNATRKVQQELYSAYSGGQLLCRIQCSCSVYLGTTLNTNVSQWNYIYCYVTDTEKLRHWTAGNESRVIYTYNDCNAKLCLSSSTQQHALRMIPLLTRITKINTIFFDSGSRQRQNRDSFFSCRVLFFCGWACVGNGDIFPAGNQVAS